MLKFSWQTVGFSSVLIGWLLISTSTASANSIESTTSVAELSGASLSVQKLGCLEGYPNHTYQGDRVMSRDEYAAGMNGCLTKVQGRFTNGISNLIDKQDLINLQQNQNNLYGESGSLQNRLNKLGEQSDLQTSRQFSPTTKLNASAVFSLTNSW